MRKSINYATIRETDSKEIKSLKKDYNKAILKEKIACRFAACGVAAMVLGGGLVFSSRFISINEYPGYNDFNKEYKQQQIETVMEQLLNREISFEEYEKSVSEIQDYDPTQYAEEQLDEVTGQKLIKQNEIADNTFSAGFATFVAGFGVMAAAAVCKEVFEHKKDDVSHAFRVQKQMETEEFQKGYIEL